MVQGICGEKVFRTPLDKKKRRGWSRYDRLSMDVCVCACACVGGVSERRNALQHLRSQLHLPGVPDVCEAIPVNSSTTPIP